MSLVRWMGHALGAGILLLDKRIRARLAEDGETLMELHEECADELQGAKGATVTARKPAAKKPAAKPAPKPPARTTPAGVPTPAEKRRQKAIAEQRLANLAKGRETAARNRRAKARAEKAGQ